MTNKADYRSVSFFLIAVVAFLSWHLVSVWWIVYASGIGVVFVITTNVLIMSSTVWLIHAIRRRVGVVLGYLAFVLIWMSYEYLHFRWEMSWPWFNLGGWLSKNIYWIQWYEYTGILGGTLWILLVNSLIYKTIQLFLLPYKWQTKIRSIILSVLIFIVPILISQYIYSQIEDTGNSYEVVVVQPNIDSFTEKYNQREAKRQFHLLLHLADSLSDENTDYIVFPETSVPIKLWEDLAENHESIQQLRQFVARYPHAEMLVGLYTLQRYENWETASSTARQSPRNKTIYDYFNTAILLDSISEIQYYHKSKFVIGAEKMPFSYLLKPLEGLIVDFGGFVGSLGSDAQRSVFVSKNGNVRIAPVICYESVYGDFVGDFITKSANLIVIITNDGWWKDTQGYKQHWEHARLRAIETRRYVARSANTGISGFINSKGETISQAPAWQATALKAEVRTNSQTTFYSRYGDFIGLISLVLAIGLVLYVLVFARKV